MTNILLTALAITKCLTDTTNQFGMTAVDFNILKVQNTNWTGHIVGTNELGYISTDHMLAIRYEGQSNVFKLKSVPGNTAVWRPKSVVEYYYSTNSMSPWIIPMPDPIYLTNLVSPKNATTEQP